MLEREHEDPMPNLRRHVNNMRAIAAEMERLGPLLTQTALGRLAKAIPHVTQQAYYAAPLPRHVSRPLTLARAESKRSASL